MSVRSQKENTLTNSPIPSKENSTITFRELSTFEEYLECVNIQKETWGDAFEEWVPTAILKISQKVGGIVAAAFNEKNRMIGFVYGLTGIKDGRLAHWSHMLAVRKEARALGIGRQLKLYQRELLLARGVHVAYWTYDPLVARNANLNLNSLGAIVGEYVKDMYLESSSGLHRGMNMDRFIVAWHLESDRVAKALSNQPMFDRKSYDAVPIVNTQQQSNGSSVPAEHELPHLPNIRVEIPADIETVKSESMSLAREWRSNTRRVFLWCQERGYRVDGFYSDSKTGRCFYCLTQSLKETKH